MPAWGAASQVVEDWFEAAKQHATVLETHLVRQTKLIENLHKSRQGTLHSPRPLRISLR